MRCWLLRFDGVAQAGDHGLADPQGWGAVEYAYAKMARAAGIAMTECRLLEEGGRRRFIGVDGRMAAQIARSHRLTLPRL